MWAAVHDSASNGVYLRLGADEVTWRGTTPGKTATMLHSGKQPIPLDAEIGHVHQEVLGVVDSTTQLNMLIMCHKVKSHKRRFLKNLIFFPKIQKKLAFQAKIFWNPSCPTTKLLLLLFMTWSFNTSRSLDPTFWFISIFFELDWDKRSKKETLGLKGEKISELWTFWDIFFHRTCSWPAEEDSFVTKSDRFPELEIVDAIHWPIIHYTKKSQTDSRPGPLCDALPDYHHTHH